MPSDVASVSAARWNDGNRHSRFVKTDRQPTNAAIRMCSVEC